MSSGHPLQTVDIGSEYRLAQLLQMRVGAALGGQASGGHLDHAPHGDHVASCDSTTGDQSADTVAERLGDEVGVRFGNETANAEPGGLS